MPTFSQEIFDGIIDHLHNDKNSLRACALTCRFWLPSARQHLFHTIIIDDIHQSNLFSSALDTNPSLGIYIQALSLDDFSPDMLH